SPGGWTTRRVSSIPSRSPLRLMDEINAQLSPCPGAGCDLFLHRASVGSLLGSAGAAYLPSARGGRRNPGPLSVPYGCLGGAAGPYALPVDAATGRCRLRRALPGP